MPQVVSDIMTHSVVTVDMDETLERIRDMFEHSRFHHLVVIDDRRVVGIISDRDLLKHLSPFLGNALMERKQDEETLQRKAHQIMRRKPVTVRKDATLMDAARLLLSEHVSCLPVVTNVGRLRGIITWRDLLPHCFGCETNLAA